MPVTKTLPAHMVLRVKALHGKICVLRSEPCAAWCGVRVVPGVNQAA